jgi:hypothetical protein
MADYIWEGERQVAYIKDGFARDQTLQSMNASTRTASTRLIRDYAGQDCSFGGPAVPGRLFEERPQEMSHREAGHHSRSKGN